jgi:5'(3')-deoxyribonucleotidase
MQMISIITSFVPHVLDQLHKVSDTHEVIVATTDKDEFNTLYSKYPWVKSRLVPFLSKMEPQPPPTYWENECKLGAFSNAKHEWICFLDSAIDIDKIISFHIKELPALVYYFSDAVLIHKSVIHLKHFRNYAQSVEQSIIDKIPRKLTMNLININKGLSVIIPYCSLEKDLMDDVLESLDGACDEIIIVYLTHLFDGTLDTESDEVIKNYKLKYPCIKDICVQWTPKKTHQGYWPCTMRKIGYLQSTKDWILLIDSDETIQNKDTFTKWFQSVRDGPIVSYKLANYWYFLSKQRRSKTLEDSIVIVKREEINIRQFSQYATDRDSFVNKNTPRMTKDLDGNPMFNHYSWVRSKEVLLKKVKTWGHREDRDWIPMVEKAFSEDILTTPDFVHNYTYEILN